MEKAAAVHGTEYQWLPAVPVGAVADSASTNDDSDEESEESEEEERRAPLPVLIRANACTASLASALEAVQGEVQPPAAHSVLTFFDAGSQRQVASAPAQ